jgi:CheY-like chemotaxis protein
VEDQSLLRVLVIEDDPDLRLLFKQYLMRLGCQISFAATGAEALELAVEVVPDVSFVDMMLPDMLGTTVIEQLRADPRTANCRFIVASGLDPELHGVRADGLLYKPFSLEQVISVLANLPERVPVTSGRSARA